MKKTLLFFGGLIAASLAFSQTTIFSEDFESGAGGFTLNTATQGGDAGTSGSNYWVVNNDYAGGSGNVATCAPLTGFAFTIPATPAQPVGITSINGGYLHIQSAEAAANGITSTSYSPAENALCVFSASHFTQMTADINTTAFTGVTFDFWWLNNNGTDGAGELWYSVNGGTTWTQKTGTNFYGAATWTNTALTDAAWDGQATLRFGFRFNNVGITGAADPALAIDDVEITGTSGACSNSTSSFTETACITYTVPSGDETYTVSGTVMDTILNATGCDSIMTITVNITTPNVGVSTASNVITAAAASGVTYAWINCSDSSLIAGATLQTYTPTANGDYAVIITESGCADTSTCETIAGLGFYEQSPIGFSVYPNPAASVLNFQISNPEIIYIEIWTLDGKRMEKDKIYGVGKHTVDLSSFENGTYLVYAITSEGHLNPALIVKE